MPDAPYLIKRYSNRKLYDSVRRRFTTLDEVAKLIEDGVKVLVRDHATGADRTDEVLAQVLGRRVRKVSNPATSDLLTGLLRKPAGVARKAVDQIAPSGSSEDEEVEEEVEEVEEAEEAEETGGSAQQEAQQEEIRELRDQVAQLTEAVTMLLKEKNDELQRQREAEDS